jgi:hypothetical protein
MTLKVISFGTPPGIRQSVNASHERSASDRGAF